MNWKNVSESDLVGRFFIRKPGVQGLLGYYKTIYQLLPLFKTPKFQQHVSGCYVNEPGKDIFGIVRLSYFTPPNMRAAAVQNIETFLTESKLDEIYTRTGPEEDHVARDYGGDEFELPFRKFLALETRIGLELVDANHLEVQSLLIKFRRQKPRNSSEIYTYFDPIFQKSGTYCDLSIQEKDFLWENLSRNPPSSRSDWAHFLVNLILGFDPPPFLSNVEIAKDLKSRKLPFRISGDKVYFV